MAKSPNPYTILRRTDSNSFRLTLNPSCGLPKRVCDEWFRRSFQHLPAELADLRSPKDKPAAKAAALALIALLKKKQEEGSSARRVTTADITVGAWLEKFIAMETSPRTGINASRNRPYSPKTLEGYKSYYNIHIKDDPLVALQMSELEEEDILEYINRLHLHKKHGKKNGETIGGTRTAAGVIVFLRMAFKNFQRKFPRWYNPFSGLDAPKLPDGSRDALPEDEVIRLFFPGVLKTSMEMAVCACMFFSGLRRAEIAALRPEDLNWQAPKIVIRRAWQNYDKKSRVLGPPKGKRSRDAPFDPVLQEAIKKIWQEHGQHEWVFSFAGKILNPDWIGRRFPKWLKDAGIELNGREIVPHSSRHSLASLLEERGVPERYIQELLGHANRKTTRGYLHSTEKTIRDIGKKISEIMGNDKDKNIVNFKISS